jgi:hypothetical protein
MAGLFELCPRFLRKVDGYSDIPVLPSRKLKQKPGLGDTRRLFNMFFFTLSGFSNAVLLSLECDHVSWLYTDRNRTKANLRPSGVVGRWQNIRTGSTSVVVLRKQEGFRG